VVIHRGINSKSACCRIQYCRYSTSSAKAKVVNVKVVNTAVYLRVIKVTAFWRIIQQRIASSISRKDNQLQRKKIDRRDRTASCTMYMPVQRSRQFVGKGDAIKESRDQRINNSGEFM
jgi:hypothetical protein